MGPKKCASIKEAVVTADEIIYEEIDTDKVMIYLAPHNFAVLIIKKNMGLTSE